MLRINAWISCLPKPSEASLKCGWARPPCSESSSTSSIANRSSVIRIVPVVYINVISSSLFCSDITENHRMWRRPCLWNQFYIERHLFVSFVSQCVAHLRVAWLHIRERELHFQESQMLLLFAQLSWKQFRLHHVTCYLVHVITAVGFKWFLRSLCCCPLTPCYWLIYLINCWESCVSLYQAIPRLIVSCQPYVGSRYRLCFTTGNLITLYYRWRTVIVAAGVQSCDLETPADPQEPLRWWWWKCFINRLSAKKPCYTHLHLLNNLQLWS